MGVLEEIRLLGNLETQHGKLLQIVLAGQPELDRKLEAPNMRQLKQCIVLRCTLDPLSLRDSIDYIQSRLACAGAANQTVFSEDLMSEIHRRSLGIPRLINAICDNLLLTAFAMERKICDLEILDEVCRDMRLDWPGSEWSRRSRRQLAEESFEQAPYTDSAGRRYAPLIASSYALRTSSGWPSWNG